MDYLHWGIFNIVLSSRLPDFYTTCILSGNSYLINIFPMPTPKLFKPQVHGPFGFLLACNSPLIDKPFLPTKI